MYKSPIKFLFLLINLIPSVVCAQLDDGYSEYSEASDNFSNYSFDIYGEGVSIISPIGFSMNVTMGGELTSGSITSPGIPFKPSLTLGFSPQFNIATDGSFSVGYSYGVPLVAGIHNSIVLSPLERFGNIIVGVNVFNLQYSTELEINGPNKATNIKEIEYMLDLNQTDWVNNIILNQTGMYSY